MKKELYRWQRECLEAWEKNDRHGIVHVVTGAGKTVLAMAAIDRARALYPDLMVRIVVPKIPLASQWETELLHHADGEEWRPGFFGGGKRDDPDRHVMVYIVNSARDSLAGHIRRDLALRRHVLLICDECHHYQSRENRRIFGFLKDLKKMRGGLQGRASAAEKALQAVRHESAAQDSLSEPAEKNSLSGPAEKNSLSEPAEKNSISEPAAKNCLSGPAAKNSLAGSSAAFLYFSLGLSATPFGTADDSVLVRSLGKEIYRYGFDTAVREGIISPFTVCEVSASFFAEERAIYAELSEKISFLLGRLYAVYPSLETLQGKAFMKAVQSIAQEADMDPEEPACAFLLLTLQRKEISNLAKARNACCLSLLDRLRPEDRVLVFCERISQAEDMSAQIRRRFGNVCGLYHSGMDREARERVLGEFRENRTRILVSCRCLDEGIDVPDANIGIVMSSTAVERQRIQRLGRVIRRSEGKAAACLYYIYIRESTDDSAFLPDLKECETFHLRYFSAEDVFSNDLYEYVGGNMVRSAREKGYSPEQAGELRACLAEGLARADYLLEEEEQIRQAQKASDRHARNYWKVMRRIGAEFRDPSAEACPAGEQKSR